MHEFLCCFIFARYIYTPRKVLEGVTTGSSVTNITVRLNGERHRGTGHTMPPYI